MRAFAEELAAAGDAKERSRLLLSYAQRLPALAAEERRDANRVMGCTAQVWLSSKLDPASGLMAFAADSDSELTRGLAAIVCQSLSGLTPDQVLEVDPACLLSLSLGPGVLMRSRTNGFLNMLEAAKKRARLATADLPRFPSLLIGRRGTEAQGAFAEAQARLLGHRARAGAGALHARARRRRRAPRACTPAPSPHPPPPPHPTHTPPPPPTHTHHPTLPPPTCMCCAQAQFLRPDPATVDRLAGLLEAKRIGVVAHFYMDPEVQGVLSSAAERWPHVKVSDSLVMADGAAIGCSLAEAAESPAYEAYVAEAGATPNSLHVVYINTSLKTKALAHEAVPTITCTSSNVVQTVLTAFAQGACIVHHLFGGEVCELVAASYGDAYLVAHFEVPGEMFRLAIDAQRQRGMGVVGSTQNILDYIGDKLAEALARPFSERLQFVLGTESGMITSIVRRVQAQLEAAGRDDVAVEIVFPVSRDAITTDRQGGGAAGGGGGEAALGGLRVVPGPAGGEGCSLEGGCASCPYMKMNSLEALLTVCERVGSPAGEAMLEGFKSRAYAEHVGGKTMAAAGCVPILHMRAFQKGGRLPDALVDDVVGRRGAA
eukprot:scaffold8.g1402.t1